MYGIFIQTPKCCTNTCKVCNRLQSLTIMLNARYLQIVTYIQPK